MIKKQDWQKQILMNTFLNNSSQGATTNNTHTFSNLFDDTSYTLKVVVTDKAGNNK